MGKKGKEIVKAKLDEVIKDLVAAYSDEWLAHYQYWLTARWIRGLDADTLKGVLEKQSADELVHAGKLAERIIQLGGQPVIHDVLNAEACAIDYYSKMCEKYRTTDIVTHEIFEDLLKDEVDDEEEWEKFLTKP